MIPSSPITTLFLDIGGVLLTNGWDHHIRTCAADKFGLDFSELNERHHLTFDIYEEGKLNLDEYLNRVVFYDERSFSRNEFKAFMFAQSKPFAEMLDRCADSRSNTVWELQRSVMKSESLRFIVFKNSN